MFAQGSLLPDHVCINGTGICSTAPVNYLPQGWAHDRGTNEGLLSRIVEKRPTDKKPTLHMVEPITWKLESSWWPYF